MPRRPVLSPSSADLAAHARRLAQLEANPALVPHIHHYCDRWCERCPLRSACLSYQLEQTRQAAQGWARRDPLHRSSWEQLARVVASKLQRLEDEPARPVAEDVRPAAPSEPPWHTSAEAIDLLARARRYRQRAREILLRLPAVLAVVPPTSAQPAAGTAWSRVREAVEVVDWFVFFIEAKLQRAAASCSEETGRSVAPQTSDAAGSAKVALIAIDRSMGAWATLRRHCTREADPILDVLAQLERLRSNTERAFPAARAFQRPGFDQAALSRTAVSSLAAPPHCG